MAHAKPVDEAPVGMLSAGPAGDARTMRADMPVPPPRPQLAGPVTAPDPVHEAIGGACILERPEGGGGCWCSPNAGGQGDTGDGR